MDASKAVIWGASLPSTRIGTLRLHCASPCHAPGRRLCKLRVPQPWLDQNGTGQHSRECLCQPGRPRQGVKADKAKGGGAGSTAGSGGGSSGAERRRCSAERWAVVQRGRWLLVGPEVSPPTLPAQPKPPFHTFGRCLFWAAEWHTHPLAAAPHPSCLPCPTPLQVNLANVHIDFCCTAGIRE